MTLEAPKQAGRFDQFVKRQRDAWWTEWNTLKQRASLRRQKDVLKKQGMRGAVVDVNIGTRREAQVRSIEAIGVPAELVARGFLLGRGSIVASLSLLNAAMSVSRAGLQRSKNVTIK